MLQGPIAATVGVLMFGTCYIPVRFRSNGSETYDSSVFQWMMGSGILGVGMLVQLCVGGEVLSAGLLGGALWATSNLLVLPAVRLLGLGVGFSMYHVVNLSTGYIVGRFGLFGAPVDVASNPLLRDCSVLLLLFSFSIMLAVEPHVTLADEAGEAKEEGDEAAALPSHAAASDQPLATLRQPLLTTASHSKLPSEQSEASETTFHYYLRGRYAAWRRESAEEGKAAPTALDSDELTPAPSYNSVAINGVPLRSSSSDVLFPMASEQGGIVAYLRRLLTARSRGARPQLIDEEAEKRTEGAAEERGGTPKEAEAKSSEAKSSEAKSSEAEGGTSERSGKAGPLPEEEPSPPSRATGIFFALLAGVACGVNMVPYAVWNAERPEGVSPLTFLFSQCLGIYGTSTVFYFGFALLPFVQGNSVPHSSIRPAYVSGAMWALGEAAQFVAIHELGYVEGFVFLAIGPVMVSAIISAVFFGEIRGYWNLVGFSMALLLQLVGVLMLAAGS
ncbi:hypothetical protein AB1Y20_012089 [Prymnesium parvum]|uniref:Transmembrane protein n=1 Tax=Prymnesium parvum TaxID=97485 RepID=A0AB34IQ86_PRYPA